MFDSSSEFIEKIDNAVRFHFMTSEGIPEESEVRQTYTQYFDAFKILPQFASTICDREAVVDDLVKRYCSELSITKRIGFSYKDDDLKPWLSEMEIAIEDSGGWFYWKHYKTYLAQMKRWSLNTVRTIDRDTWNILDLMANPRSDEDFERRGLVVASVQSGKTANYLGLICRAADVGYKIIVVMAGVHNVLRNQTQARLEEGFAGINIVGQRIAPVGVGKMRGIERRPILCTSREADFKKERAQALRGLQTTQTNEPLLFVIKKNSSVLKQLYEWLCENAKSEDPILLIDDEADNASINGKYKRERRDDEPSRINGQIRNILSYFSKKCYVGYTATPYANILIDPIVDTKEFGKDLFPSSFIYTLEESSDYFGAEKIFYATGENGKEHLRYIDDIGDYLPPKHKSDFEIETLPNSLKKAIRTFLLALAIRTLRGDGSRHCTMMVNASPYRRTQRSVALCIGDYVEELKRHVKVYGAFPSDEAVELSDELAAIKSTWYEEYQAVGYCWEEIQEVLFDAVRAVRVVSINSDSSDGLNYESQTEHVIAVGGYRLSRGLTLEGLVVSYYSRNARAYDALMQMARWFGYRPNYEDLCRIWMSREAAGWYEFVAGATEDLFDELRNMRQLQRTPKNYGLKIKQSPDSLLVTARNKIGTGTTLAAPIDLNNGFVETIAFDRDPMTVKRNREIVKQLISAISHYKTDENLFYRHVPVEWVLGFIRNYQNEDARSPKSQSKPLIRYVNERLRDGELQEWDVYIAAGEGPAIELSTDVTVRREIRYPGSATNQSCLVVGEKHRLASRGVESKGLSEEQIEEARRDFVTEHPTKKANASDRYYRRRREFPLLVIHPVLMTYSDSQRQSREEAGAIEPEAGSWPSWQHAEEAFGWSISFPYTSQHTRPVEYVFNQVAIEDLRADYEEESDDDFEDN